MKPSAQGPLKPHQTTLVIAGLVSLFLWTVPTFGFILLPLQYLNTHLHEFSHALMATMTGGTVMNIHVDKNGSGVTPVMGGSPFLVGSAGYLGATAIGALMIFFGRSERGAGVTLRILGCIMLVTMVCWVRGDLVGIVSGLLWMALLFALPILVKGRNLVFVTQLLGMQQCLSSIQALYSLFKISAYGGAQNDAGNMASFTGIPALFWAVLWGAIGLFSLYVTLRSSWTNRPAE